MRKREEIEHRKHLSQATKDKIGLANRGRKKSPELLAQVTKHLRKLAREAKGKKRDPEIGRKISASKKGIATAGSGDKHPMWAGDEVGYNGIHQWLMKNYGRPQVCQNENCQHKSKIFEWVKLRGWEYKRRRENFIRLCRSCHRSYDTNPKFEVLLVSIDELVSTNA